MGSTGFCFSWWRGWGSLERVAKGMQSMVGNWDLYIEVRSGLWEEVTEVER
jgi:hypothetical protein